MKTLSSLQDINNPPPRNLAEKQHHGNVGHRDFDDEIQTHMKSTTSKASFILDTDRGHEEDDEAIMIELINAGAPIPPDGGYGWVIVFVSFVCNLTLDGITCTFGVFLPQMVESFEAGKGQVAWAGSLLCGVSLCIGPIVSAMTNKYGCRLVCITGGIIASIAFIISSFAESLLVMFMSYGILGAIGFGLMYLPNIVSVGYYFEKRRSLATGIAVCGSGVGATTFAPMASWLTANTTWRNVNLLYAALLFICGCCGVLIRPLEIKREALDDFTEDDADPKRRPLLFRMAEEKKQHLERNSMAGSEYFVVQLADGSTERRLKLPLNVDPGVHSTFHLDQFTLSSHGPHTPALTMTPIHVPLMTITEAKHRTWTESKEFRNGSCQLDPGDPVFQEQNENEVDLKNQGNHDIPNMGNSHGRMSYHDEVGVHSEYSTYKNPVTLEDPSCFRNEVEFMLPESRSLRKYNRTVSLDEYEEPSGEDGSVDRLRSCVSHDGSVTNEGLRVETKYSIRAVPTPIFTAKLQKLFSSRSCSHHESVASFVGFHKGSQCSTDENSYFVLSKDEFPESHRSLKFETSIIDDPYNSIHLIIRPLSRKDVFYSGSITHLPEYNVPNYRQSILNVPFESGHDKSDTCKTHRKPSICPYLRVRADDLWLGLRQVMDLSLIKNKVFLCFASSGVVGMLGFYIPFVYIVDFCREKGIPSDDAAILLSIIGIINTIGRVGFGLVSDLPQVNSLYLNNACLLFMGISVTSVPLCDTYTSLVIVYILFGLSLSGFISLTSIVLVDLLGLDNLTNSFGLLMFFRGIASIVGSPFGGFLYDVFNSSEVPFYVAGAFLLISSLISSLIPLLTKFESPKEQLRLKNINVIQHLEDIPEVKEPDETSNTSSDEINNYIDNGAHELKHFIIDEDKNDVIPTTPEETKPQNEIKTEENGYDYKI